MANPIGTEAEVFAKLKRGELQLAPELWDVLSHHLSNDVYAMILILETALARENDRPLTLEETKKLMQRCKNLQWLIDQFRTALGRIPSGRG